jgi:hypothetical protein
MRTLEWHVSNPDKALTRGCGAISMQVNPAVNDNCMRGFCLVLKKIFARVARQSMANAKDAV